MNYWIIVTFQTACTAFEWKRAKSTKSGSRFRANPALTPLPRLRIKLQAVEERRTGLLRHSVPLPIDRTGDSLDFSFILHLLFRARKQGAYSQRWSIHVLTPSTATLSRIRCELIDSRPLPKSLTMDRQFPPEIIQLIVEASLDPRDPSRGQNEPFYRRYAILKKYSVLNSTWRSISELLLYNWVFLRSYRAATRFLTVLEARGGTMDEIRELRITWEAADAANISSVLRVTRRVTNLVILGGAVSIDDLAQLQQLRQLELSNVEVAGSPATSTLCLSSLQLLRLEDCTISTPHFLSLAFLPQLRYLDVFDFAAPTALWLLVPQLWAIQIPSSDSALIRAATSLRLLTIPFFPPCRLELLDNLPSFPPFVSIHDCYYRTNQYSRQQLIDTLEQLIATTKTGLRVVLLHGSGPGIDETVAGLVKQLEGRATRVVWVEQEPTFDGSILAMEKILAEDRRAQEAIVISISNQDEERRRTARGCDRGVAEREGSGGKGIVRD